MLATWLTLAALLVAFTVIAVGAAQLKAPLAQRIAIGLATAGGLVALVLIFA